ncbi:MAG TPA: thioredoxin fold domain-containing protein [Patescibacteria group bacterium]|nr:thioredoxin fold domain-containing protein [Patescibacteria group bacterium]
MRKDWALISIVALIIFVGLGLAGYLKFSKKKIVANPLPSLESQQVAGTQTGAPAYFAEDAKVSYFYSEYCHWCQKEKEVLAELAKEGYRVKPMNLGEKPDLAQGFNVTGTPTFIAENGERLVGYQTKEPLKAWLDKHK